ncbi:MAG: ester cyclase, partial [Bacteroidota bacterium]
MRYVKVYVLLFGLFFSFSSCVPTPNTHTAEIEKKKALVSTFIQLIEAKAFSRFGEIIADDYQQHNPMVKQGLAGIQEGASWFSSIFPDLSASIDEVLVEGDLVVARITWTGTHSEELFGIPASGMKVSWTGT